MHKSEIGETLGGKVAVVTGATGGLGEAICTALAGAGARVLAVARGSQALEALASRHAAIEPWPADVTEDDFHRRLEQTGCDILVNNAGRNTPLPMVEVPIDILDGMLNLNVRAAYLASQAAVRSMVAAGRPGCIVNITSQMGHVGAPRRTVYCMTKHALEGLTKAMAVELGPVGIRVNSVAPTFVETPMTRPMLADEDFRRVSARLHTLGQAGPAGGRGPSRALPRLTRLPDDHRREPAGRRGMDREVNKRRGRSREAHSPRPKRVGRPLHPRSWR